MALRAAVHRADMAQVSLGLGIATFILAMTIKRIAKDHRERHRVSERARALMGKELPMHIMEHIARQTDPEYICLAIAENKLTTGPLLAKIAELRRGGGCPEATSAATDASTTSAATASDDDRAGEGHGDKQGDEESNRSEPMLPTAGLAMGYDAPWGPTWVRRELAKVIGSRMFKRTVDPEKLCLAAGATAVLRLLMVALTEPGQGCLIPAPYFAGFDYTLSMAGLKAWPVVIHPGEGGVEAGVDAVIAPRALQAGFRAARSKAKGAEIRVLLLTSPHNPTGRLYSPKALLAAVGWARKRGLHVVVDEVYANTVHRLNATFRSMGSLLTEANGLGMGKDIHIIYGPGKELGVAGWRVGVLYSENDEVISAVRHMCHTCEASTDTLNIFGRLLQSPGFMESYYHKSQEGLRTAYISLVHALGREGIMHLPAEAGVFMMLDLREYLEDSTEDSETRLWRQILECTGVNLTPGAALHCTESGWYRICYGYQPIEVVSRAVERMAIFLRGSVCERTQRQEAGIRSIASPSGMPGVSRNPSPQKENVPRTAGAETKGAGAEGVGVQNNKGRSGRGRDTVPVNIGGVATTNNRADCRIATSPINCNASEVIVANGNISGKNPSGQNACDPENGVSLAEAANTVASAVGGGKGGSADRRNSNDRGSRAPPTLMNSPDAMSVVDTDEEHDEALLAVGQALPAVGQACLEEEEREEAAPLGGVPTT